MLECSLCNKNSLTNNINNSFISTPSPQSQPISSSSSSSTTAELKCEICSQNICDNCSILSAIIENNQTKFSVLCKICSIKNDSNSQQIDNYNDNVDEEISNQNIISNMILFDYKSPQLDMTNSALNFNSNDTQLKEPNFTDYKNEFNSNIFNNESSKTNYLLPIYDNNNNIANTVAVNTSLEMQINNQTHFSMVIIKFYLIIF
jgi:hypothetical protein